MPGESISKLEPSKFESALEAPFYISATDIASRPRHSLKYDDTFLVLDHHGDVGAASGGPDGLFHKDTRFLSRLEVLLNGEHCLLLGSNMRDDNSLLSVDLTNPDYYEHDQLRLQKDIIHLARTIYLWGATAYQRLAVRNFGDRPIELRLSINFDSDFADLFEVRGLKRPRRGSVLREVASADQVSLSYAGLDRTQRCTLLTFAPAPTELSTTAAVYRLSLAPGETSRIVLAVSCNEAKGFRPAPFLRGLLAANRERRSHTRDIASVETSNEVFNEVLRRSAADLAILVTNTPEGRYPYAGIPWYSTTFGRDGLITALQTLWCDPEMARGVLRRLAAFQAKVIEPVSDAEPGKILHEMRSGEMVALGEVPFGLYYGSADATPLFLLLAGSYAERTGDYRTIEGLWPAVEAALAWIDGPGDADQDGFVEYHRKSDRGLANQGWKDSHDAIFHEDGRLAEGSIALAEVQGYVFAAKQAIASCARSMGRIDQARKLETEAQILAEKFEAAFWCRDLGTYVLALDGEKKPCRVRTSNAGQVLFTGIARADRAASVESELLGPSFFSGWGVRTVARGEARYNPMSYHNGSIWPHDNALIALGLARYGSKRGVAQIFTGLFEAATYMELRRLPELFCGFKRQRRRGPTLYPVACAPQAWASATPFSLIQSSLGLEFDPVNMEIRLRNPWLPAFLGSVTLRNLQLGDSIVDLRVHGAGDDVSLEILRSHGKIQVSMVLSQ